MKEEKQAVQPPTADQTKAPTPADSAKKPTVPKLPSLPKMPRMPIGFKYMFLPVMFLKFWFIESPWRLLVFFGSLNSAFFHLFSLPLFLRTFFKPVKNEYRQGLVGFSIAMGIFIRSIFIVADTIMLVLLLLFEITIFVGYVFLPIATIWLVFL